MEPRRTHKRSGKIQSEERVPQLSRSTDNAEVHRASQRKGRDVRRATDTRDMSRRGRTAARDVSESQSIVTHKVARKEEFRDMNAMYSGEKEVTSIRRGNSKKSKNKSDDSRVTYREGNHDFVNNAPVRSKASLMIDKPNELKPGEELVIDTPVIFLYETETSKGTPQIRAQSNARQDKIKGTSIYGSSDICLTDELETEPSRAMYVRGLSPSDQTPGGACDASPQDEQDTGKCIACWDKTHIWKASCCSAEMCFPCLDTYVTAKVDSGMIDIKCPGSCCEKQLSSNLMKTIIRPEKIMRLKYLRVKHGWYPHIKTCPFCDNMHDLRDMQSVGLKPKKITCQGCGKAWCSHCELPWHGKMKCLDYVERETGIRKWAENRHKKSQDARNARQCPGCQVRIYFFKWNRD